VNKESCHTLNVGNTSLHLINLINLKMVNINKGALFDTVSDHIKSLLQERQVSRNRNQTGDGKVYDVRACCTCDCLLDYDEIDTIAIKDLLKLEWALTDKSLHKDLQDYYHYESSSSNIPRHLKAKICKLALSPRSVFHENVSLENENQPRNNRNRVRRNVPGFSICNICLESIGKEEMPPFCINNGFAIGEAPPELLELNMTERLMICQGRSDFTILSGRGGSHSTLRMYQQMFHVDLEHLEACLTKMDEYRTPKNILCTLVGPFTKRQYDNAKKHCFAVNREKVMNALLWLQDNNYHYEDMTIAQDIQFPDPIIMEDIEEVDQQDNNLENTTEVTVIFPQMTEIRENNGGYDNQADFKQEVLLQKLSNPNTLVILNA